jgi:hypothetical protein
MRHVVHVPATLAVILLCTALLPAQYPITRFFVLPDTSPAPGSDSMFSGTEAATAYSFDFTEDIRYDQGGFVTLSQDPGNSYVWNVVDFRLPATDVGLGSQMDFIRPTVPGPCGTWTSSNPNGFPNYSTVTVSMTGDLTASGPLAGVFPSPTTLTLSGTIVPGYYHSVILLTGAFSGISGTISLLMKNDFFPPAVTWDLIVHAATSSAIAPAAPSASAVQGGLTLQRGIATPNIYEVVNLYLEVGASPIVVITIPPGQTGGTLTFDSGSRGLTGFLNVLVDGVPSTLSIDGIGESFFGSVMHPTALVIDQAAGPGTLTGLHLELSVTELVPASPPLNDFQIGLTTSLVMRGRPGDIYACGATFTALPGINTPVGDIPVTVDSLLILSLDPSNPYFSNMLGNMPLAGEVLISIALPNDPSLIGATFFMGGATFDPSTLAVHAATNSHRATVK